MFIEVHIPDRITLNSDLIYSIGESSGGNAVISYGFGEVENRILICEETYDEIWDSMTEEGER